MTSIGVTEFEERADYFLKASGKAPVFIDCDSSGVRVLLTFAEYDRLKACETRHALYASKLSPE